MSIFQNLSRRDVLKGTGVAAGLVVGAQFLPKGILSGSDAEAAGNFAPNVFVSIDNAGEVTITCSRIEMGQGVRTGIPMMLADELSDTIRSDDGILLFDGRYFDGDSTTDYLNDPAPMQVAMNCQHNHFTLNPGGGDPGSGGRRIRIDFENDTGPISTGITSCIGHPNISVDNTDMTGPDCNGSDPDWAFQQLLRAFADSIANVCLLLGGQSVNATMRLQTNLYHLTNCEGGAKKCGVKLEAIDINYDNATITCTDDPGTSPCTQWSVVSNSAGVLAHGSGGEPVPGGDYAVNITFDKYP